MLRKRKIALPSNASPLLAFLLFALIASFIGALFSPIELRGIVYSERVLRAWISLLIGLAFFFAAFWMNRSEGALRHTLKWLYISLAVTLVWSFVQAIALNTALLPRSFVNDIQLLFSERGVQPRRITGFAYEPSWLADQILLFFMPWLYAALITRRPLTSKKWLEPALFILAFAVLLFTFSRSGLLGAIITIVLVSLVVGRKFIANLIQWFTSPFRNSRKSESSASVLSLRFAILFLILIAVVGSGAFLGQYDYFANLWQAADAQNFTNYLIEINVAQRVAYAFAGYEVFEQFPLTGVGLGGSALYLYDQIPDWARNLQEVARQLSPDSSLIPNTKNLYVRLLAETGLPGFWFFIAFMLSFLGIIRRQYLAEDATLKFVAVAGLFLWVGLAIRNLTQDSLTFPIMWVSLGIIAGLSPPKNE
jgi:O-antigen ligase